MIRSKHSHKSQAQQETAKQTTQSIVKSKFTKLNILMGVSLLVLTLIAGITVASLISNSDSQADAQNVSSAPQEPSGPGVFFPLPSSSSSSVSSSSSSSSVSSVSSSSSVSSISSSSSVSISSSVSSSVSSSSISSSLSSLSSSSISSSSTPSSNSSSTLSSQSSVFSSSSTSLTSSVSSSQASISSSSSSLNSFSSNSPSLDSLGSSSLSSLSSSTSLINNQVFSSSIDVSTINTGESTVRSGGSEVLLGFAIVAGVAGAGYFYYVQKQKSVLHTKEKKLK